MDLRERFENIRRNELEKFLKKNQHLSEKERKNIERMSKDIIGKLLHHPSANLKNIKHETDRFEYARMLNDLFDLKSETKKKL